MNIQIAKLAQAYDKQYPNNRDLIIDLADLADSEVSEGGSIDNELELMQSELIEALGELSK